MGIFCVHAVSYSHRPAKVCLILVSPHYRSLAAESSIRYVHASSCRMMCSLPLLLTLFSHPPPFYFIGIFLFSVVFHRSFLLSASSFLIGISLLSTFVFDGGFIKISKKIMMSSCLPNILLFGRSIGKSGTRVYGLY